MKKRKFRAMTLGEHCFDSRMGCRDGCEYRQGACFCSYFHPVGMVQDKNKPYKTFNVTLAEETQKW